MALSCLGSLNCKVVGFPKNFLQHGIFLHTPHFATHAASTCGDTMLRIIQAFFANIGYCGKLGVATGFVSIAVGHSFVIPETFFTRMK